MAMDVNVRVQVEFPAMDRLIDFLCKEKVAVVSNPVVEEKPVEVTKEEPEKVVPINPRKAKTEAPKVEEPVVEAPPVCEEDEAVAEPQTAVETPVAEERVYTAEELANAAMKLRDADKENAKRIKEKFPELGIKSIGELRTNEAVRKPFAELLISLGAEL